jgi:hypothetical protein
MPPGPVKVVLSPDALGEALLDPAGQPLLQAWRDERLQPIVSRLLLVRYFRLLRRLALPERLLRWWAYWLASPTKAQILNDPAEPGSLPCLCEALAASGRASFVITGTRHTPTPTPKVTDDPSPRWITLPEWVDLRMFQPPSGGE